LILLISASWLARIYRHEPLVPGQETENLIGSSWIQTNCEKIVILTFEEQPESQLWQLEDSCFKCEVTLEVSCFKYEEHRAVIFKL
jgi:hypothetical protein